MSRRLARQVAFQPLFQIGLADSGVETALEQRMDDAALDVETQEYVKEVVRGVMQKLPAIDAQISAVSKGWQVHRLGFVERNILRLAN